MDNSWLRCHRCGAHFTITSPDAWGWTVAVHPDGTYGEVLCTICGVSDDSSHISYERQHRPHETGDETHG